MFDVALSKAVLDACAARGWMFAAAESCTGGLIAAALTEVAGSSSVVDRGLVTYSNAAKTQMLGVNEALIHQHGAVSEEVARAMADGAVKNSAAQIAVSVTGVAGPDGGTADKPVGTVCFGLAIEGQETTTWRRQFADEGRAAIRMQSVKFALEQVLKAAKSGV